MKLVKILSMVMALTFITSCGHFGKKHKSCCGDAKMSKECKEGQCKADMSCCKNKDGKCKGNPEDCKGKQCKLKKGDCKGGKCDMKKKSDCGHGDHAKKHDCKTSPQCKDGQCVLKRDKKS
jgi:hypothetical protein